MKNIAELTDYLKKYDGRNIRIMEICGSHTAAIVKYGIRTMISKKIKLISGPGCPVCVTPSDYIDKLIEISKREGHVVVTFGDLIRVPGSNYSLSQEKSAGARVEMVYSPLETLEKARKNPDIIYVFAAVGFETTAPIYSILIEEAIKQNINNLKLFTSIKTMPQAVSWLMENDAGIDGFIAPGHVCAITGSKIFEPVSDKYRIPFAVSGFSDKELIIALYGLVKSVENGENSVKNYYTSVVERDGNKKALEKLYKYFEPHDAVWRGLGRLENSGLILKDEYKDFDIGTDLILNDHKKNIMCECGNILMGRKSPKDCPLFKKVCRPDSPQGACMVSIEGSCYQEYISAG